MKYYRLLSMLPPLPDALDDGPPLSLMEVLEAYNLELTGTDRATALAMLDAIDCTNVENLLLKRDVWDDRGPAPKEAVVERRDLPSYMMEFLAAYDAGSVSEEYPFDALWRGYAAFLLESAEASGSDFLKDWVAFDISLRDALARHRAENLGIKGDTKDSGLPDLGGSSFVNLISSLHEAANPMEAQRLIDLERLKHIDSIAGIDPFSTDAVLAYLQGILLLDRWDVGTEKADVMNMLEVFA